MNNRWAMGALGLLMVVGLIAGAAWWRMRAADRASRADEAQRLVRASVVTTVAPAPLPATLPLLGVAGKSAYGEPTQYVDRPAFRSLLVHEQFHGLTSYFERLQSDFEADPSCELWLMDAADSFASAEPEQRAPLDTWASTTPESFAPYLARAAYWKAVAYARRGGKWINDTPTGDISSMREAATLGLADLTRALSLRPKLVAARRLQIQLDVLSPTLGSTREALTAALGVCPTCFQVRVTYLFSLTPRWGGSYEAMDSFARSAVDPVLPRMRLLGGYADHDRAWLLRSEKRFDEARAAIERATALGEHWEFLVERAKIDRARGDIEHAIADLDRAAALRPGNHEVLFERAWTLMKKQRWEAAGLDLLAGLRVKPTDDVGRQMHPTVVDGLVYAAWEAHQAGRREDALRVIDLAAELAPTAPNVQHQKAAIVSGDKAPATASELEPLEQAVRAQPDDFRAHQQLDYALARKGQFDRVVGMWGEYLARHPNDGPAHLERGGAYFRMRKLDEARADASKACELGVSEGCARQQQIARALGR